MQYFGTDGVRGVANEKLTPELVYRLTRIVAHKLSEKRDKVFFVVGRDTRWSGPLLEYASLAGLLSLGVDAVQLGVVPTPAVAFFVRHLGASGGIMLSASHNVFCDNGIKFFDSNGYKLMEEVEEEIEIALRQVDNLPRPVGQGIGRAMVNDRADAYLENLIASCPVHLNGFHIVVDTAHGSSTFLATSLFRRCGARVTAIGDHPDGVNINAGFGSTCPAALQDAMRREGADIGFTLDGDGDRLLAVDRDGSIFDGDDIIAICAPALANRGLLPYNTVVVTVMSNGGLKEGLATQGIRTRFTDVGDRWVVTEMRKGGFGLGGEPSGHIVFAPHATTGDGLLTALQLLRAVQDADQSLGQLRKLLLKWPQCLVNIPLPPGSAEVWRDHPEFVACLRAADEALGDEGRVLVRASGTEPVLRIMVEAKSASQAEDWKQRLVQVLQGVIFQTQRSNGCTGS
ncbi:phosphoglucosamine mutase [Pasteuria penetrans]|uniref:phosphoglucosamine mutase n=1 Tax=Pasteuria penetrans TaxID=86005 RepID=UPI000FA745A3|nr:phosphoglucosamine mutase [Pasteuria penetrans]